MNPYVPLKTQLETERLRLGAEALERVLAEIGTIVRPGISTLDIERVALLSLKRHGLDGVLQGYQGYPSFICTSVNNVAAHGLPSSVALEEGDIVTVDISADRTGWKCDAAWTYCAGKPVAEVKRLIRSAWRCTLAGAREAKAGRRLGDVGAAIEREARRNGCSVVKEFIGHGIGTDLHEPPVVLHHGEWGGGEPIVPGMVLNIEPVVTFGSGVVNQISDGWSYVTDDGSLSAQFEVTVAVRSNGTDILTLKRAGEPIPSSFPPYC